MSSGTPEAHPVVVNTGPILALAGIGHLYLLRSLYTRVYVPEAVAQEVLRGGASGVGMTEFAEAAWIERRPVQSAPHPLVIAALDQGEAEVVTLAIELGVRHVLIDETAGRRVAQVLGLSVSGTVGACSAPSGRVTCLRFGPSWTSCAGRESGWGSESIGSPLKKPGSPNKCWAVLVRILSNDARSA